jgi:hypothetical protein
MQRIGLFIFSILVFQLTASGQIFGSEKIDSSKVISWVPKFTMEYESVFHFGDSEMESDLILFACNNNWYAQIKYGTWSEEGRWLCHFENLTNVRVVGTKFYSDKTNGEFVVYIDGNERIKGLKVLSPWSGLTEPGEYEIGKQLYFVRHYFSGKYPDASFRPLTVEELLKMSKSELKIMRNEIFARYGYKFKQGGEISKYFNKQEWYSEQHENVNSFLTEIEKANLKLIRQIERE